MGVNNNIDDDDDNNNDNHLNMYAKDVI